MVKDYDMLCRELNSDRHRRAEVQCLWQQVLRTFAACGRSFYAARISTAVPVQQSVVGRLEMYEAYCS